jgi:phage gp29-like protein
MSLRKEFCHVFSVHKLNVKRQQNKMNTHTQLTLNRLKRAKQTRFNPLTSISDPAQIARKLDAFEVGYIKEVVNIWDTLEQRDDLIRAVVSKRKKAAGRQGWTVLIRDSVPPARRAEAEEHAAALEYFYENLRCENALDRAERGGFKLLARQMMR